jgi:hypothetical protein
VATGLLGAEDGAGAEQPTATEALRDALGQQALPEASAGAFGVPQEILDAQLRVELGLPAPAAVSAAGDLELLGLEQVWERNRKPAMRAALQRWLANDTTFALATEDDTFRLLDAAVGTGIHFVIAGHTHLRRAIRRKGLGSFYLNTGTWIRLIQIPPEVLADEKRFDEVFDLLSVDSLDALDNAFIPGSPPVKLVRHQPTVGKVWVESSETRGALFEATESGSLSLIANSAFP